jgi:hypothetical protein
MRPQVPPKQISGAQQSLSVVQDPHTPLTHAWFPQSLQVEQPAPPDDVDPLDPLDKEPDDDDGGGGGGHRPPVTTARSKWMAAASDALKPSANKAPYIVNAAAKSAGP